ncbi:hypothetical protein UFOVP98_21 [uncultured Caudovirales phage]|jgi:hypothetical protein|uniref:Uncharacterized protein n=1 Tax=uncultured Caudovirales phage TaxID=2100421 RepID=A0A6J5LN75_9CAUD|nr:hypothetical protein UFOVP98_21 [uncultured Caudovirales phage]CAB4134420.1 hypothetical protein UFOVP269_49 [uncultured Caudovirales phage]
MKVKRTYEMCELEKAIIKMVWSDIQDTPRYDTWRFYQRNFTFEGKPYSYSCKFLVEDNHLRLTEAKIEHAQETIDIMH